MKAYISSTFEDLKDYRQAVYSGLRKLRIDALAMEDYSAGEQRPLDECLQGVAECDIYIGIFAWRYGFIPAEGNPNGLSITELEYRAAGDAHKERLIFVLREDTPWSPKLSDSHTGGGGEGQRIRTLRKELADRHTIVFFSSPDELAKEVTVAAARAITRLKSEAWPRATPLDESSTVQRPMLSRSLFWYRFGLKMAGAIVRIEDIKHEGRGRATGFLISGTELHSSLGPELYLTTPAHVIQKTRSPDGRNFTPEEVLIRLTGLDEEQVIRLGEIAWFSPVESLDVSIVRLVHQPAGVRGLSVAGYIPRSGSPVVVVGHRLGRELFFSLDGCRMLDHNTQTLVYTADTSLGSAGSPIFDDVWKVVGMHRLRDSAPDVPDANGHIRISDSGPIEPCYGVSLLEVKAALSDHFE